MASALAPEAAVAALRKVSYPELNRDVFASDMVKDLKLDGATVSLALELPSVGNPHRDALAAAVEAALRSAGFEKVALTVREVVRPSPGMTEAALTPGVKNIILVGAGKGGVGKSTVALNLAVALDRLGARVGLLDADIYGPSVPILTGLSARPGSRDGKRIDPLEAYGIKVMSIGFLVEPDQALIWRGPMLTGALVQLMRDVAWGDLDYLVLDLPPGTGDVPLTLSQNVRAAGVVLVSTPQDVALADVVKAKMMFDKVAIPVLGIVENMSTFVCPHCREATNIFDHGGAKIAAEKMAIRFLGEVPLDLAVREGGDKGMPVAATDPQGICGQAFREIARGVAAAVAAQNLKAPRLPIIGAQPRA